MIYISYSTDYYNCAEVVKDNLEKANTDVTMWIPGTRYSDKLIRSCDTVVFIVKNFEFDSDVEKLTLGVIKELLLALKEKKNIKIAYIKKDKTLRYYDAHLSLNAKGGLFFTGITGSGVLKLTTENKIYKNLEINDDYYLIL